jgi:hypothetical protein
MACGSEGARSCGVYTGPPTGLIPVQQPRAYYPSSHHYAPVTSQREAAIEMKSGPCKDKSDGRLKAVIQVVCIRYCASFTPFTHFDGGEL